MLLARLTGGDGRALHEEHSLGIKGGKVADYSQYDHDPTGYGGDWAVTGPVPRSSRRRCAGKKASRLAALLPKVGLNMI